MLITVKVAGCVHDAGDLKLSAGASVADAIRRAGGIGRDGFAGTGIVSVRSRRKKDGLGYCRRRIDVAKDDAASVTLRDRDLVIVQYDVDSKKEANQPPEPTRSARGSS